MKKVRVLHIIKSLGRGGAEMLLQETLAKHDQHRFEFHYIYFLPWKNQMVAGIEAAGGIVNNFPASDNIRLMLTISKVIRYIKDNKIDLIHCHLPWAGFLGRLIHKRTGIPTLYSEHNKQERYHWITGWLNRKSFNSQNAVIAVSSDVETSIRKNINPRIPIYTILNGVNTDYFLRNHELGAGCRTRWNIPQKSIVIGTIAVFRFQKRLKEWVDLFATLHSSFPEIKGVIVGDGILNTEIREHIKLRGMSEHILLPGLQTDVIPWLSAIDIFVMTSEFEGLPIALLEAMSMECTVACTDAGGIKEVIRSGTDGFLRAVSNWKDLEMDISALIQNPTAIRKWGQAARLRVIESFGIKTMVDQTERLYNLLTDR